MRTEIHWTYSPPDLTPLPCTLNQPDYGVVVGDGRVTLTFATPRLTISEDERHVLAKQMRALLYGLNIGNHKSLEFSDDCTVCQYHDDGHKDVAIGVTAAVSVLAAMGPDYQILDRDAHVVFDSRAERAANQSRHARSVLTHANDATLQAIMLSYHKACADPGNLFVHLWEILEALDATFKSNRTLMTTTLGLDPNDILVFRTLANNVPLLEGRHGGVHRGKLRPATYEEKQTGWKVSETMIEAYLQYLEGQQTSGPQLP